MNAHAAVDLHSPHRVHTKNDFGIRITVFIYSNLLSRSVSPQPSFQQNRKKVLRPVIKRKPVFVTKNRRYIFDAIDVYRGLRQLETCTCIYLYLVQMYFKCLWATGLIPICLKIQAYPSLKPHFQTNSFSRCPRSRFEPLV